MVDDFYVKQIFEIAINQTLTYQRAELHSFKFSMAELREMLLEEQLRADQSAAGDGIFSLLGPGRAASQGHRPAIPGSSRNATKGGRGGLIPGKTASPSKARNVYSVPIVNVEITI